MEEKNKNIFVGLIGISLITFNLIIATIIISPPLVTQEFISYEIFVMEYPENCFANNTSPEIISPYYIYSGVDIKLVFCHLIIDVDYLVDFINLEKKNAHAEIFTANFNQEIKYYNITNMFLNLKHGNYLQIDLYNRTNNNQYLVTVFSNYIELEN